MGKEEIARNEQFLLFPQCFLLNHKIVSPFVNIYDIISLYAAELEEPKIVKWGKGLKELLESMDRCTGRRHITKILLKTALNTIKSINQSMLGIMHRFGTSILILTKAISLFTLKAAMYHDACVFFLRDNFVSHNNPFFPCNIAITNFPVSHTCKIRFHDVIHRTVCMFTS